MINYADDTALTTTSKTLFSPGNLVQSDVELYKITNWLKANKLHINVSKTKAMIFFTKMMNLSCL